MWDDEDDDVIAGYGAGGGVAADPDDDLIREFERKRRQDLLAQQRRGERGRRPAGGGPPLAAPVAPAPGTATVSAGPAMPVRAVRSPRAIAPRDVSATGADVRGSGLEGILRSRTMVGGLEAAPGIAAEVGSDFAVGMAAHPIELAGWVAAPEVMATIGAARLGENVAKARAGAPLDRHGQPTEAPVSWTDVGLEAAGLLPIIPHAAKTGARRINTGMAAWERSAKMDARFPSALQRAQEDAASARGYGRTRALPAGQYEMGPGKYEFRDGPEMRSDRMLPPSTSGAKVADQYDTPAGPARGASGEPVQEPAIPMPGFREEPEVRPERILRSRNPVDQYPFSARPAGAAQGDLAGPGIPTRGFRETAEMRPERTLEVPWRQQLSNTKASAREASVEREARRLQNRASTIVDERDALRASGEDVDRYRRMRDAGVGVPVRELGDTRPLQGERGADYESRVMNRSTFRDTGLERSAMRAEAGYVSLRDAKGRLKRNLKDVSDGQLAQEHARILQELGEAEGDVAFTASREWEDYDALPPAERSGRVKVTDNDRVGGMKGKRRQKEDLPDGGGMFDSDDLDALRKTKAEYNKRTAVRAAQQKAADRLAGLREGVTDLRQLHTEHQEEYINEARAKLSGGRESRYTSSHWPGVENPLVHVRMNDRKLPNGEKALFLEELQSDWHQQGREYGYGSKEEIATKMADLTAEHGRVVEERGGLVGRLTTEENSDRYRALQRREVELVDEMNTLHDQRRQGVADAPFKKTPEWTELGIKRAIDEAIQTGADRVVWTTGEQQARRYDLSRHVDEARYDPATGQLTLRKDGSHVHDGKYDPRGLESVIGKEAAAKLLSAPIEEPKKGSGALKWEKLDDADEGASAVAPGGGRFTIEPSGGRFILHLPDGGSRPFNTMFRAQTHANELKNIYARGARDEPAAHVLRGLDLKVGGEGMKAYYDKMIPSAVKDYGKKIGVKIEVEPVATGAARPLEVGDIRNYAEDLRNGRESNAADKRLADVIEDVADALEGGEQSTRMWDAALDIVADTSNHSDRDIALAREALQDFEKVGGEGAPDGPNLSFKITPELRAKVKAEGQPLGFISPALLGQVGAPAAGAAVGAATGDTPEERRVNAAIGVGLGVGAAAIVGRLALKGASKPASRGTPSPALRPGTIKGTVVGSISSKGGKRVADLSPEPGPPVPPADVDPEEFVNLAKFALDPSGEDRLTAQVKRVVGREGLSPKKAVTWEQTKRAAAEIGLTPDRLSRQTRLSGPEMLAIRNIVKENTDRVVELERQLATNPKLTDNERASIDAAIGAADKQSDALLSRFVKERSRTGRDLNNMKILATATNDPVVWLARAKRQLGEAPLTDEIRSEVIRLTNLEDPDALAKYMASLKPNTAWEKMITLWKAGLLTNPTTHMANAIGNVAMWGLERAKDVPAVVLDRVLGMATGFTTKSVSARGMANAAAEGAVRGIREAKKVMRGEVQADLMRFNTQEVDFKNPVLNAYTHTVFRSLSASDKVFRELALRQALDEQARVAAKLEGWTGKAFEERTAQLKAAPTDEMSLHAIEAADYATFQDNSFLSKAATGVRRAFGKAGDVILPFTRTPANIATRVFEYTPAGALMTASDLTALLKGAGTPESQRAVVEQLGRSSIGAAALYAGYELASRGKWSGARPEAAAEREERTIEGKPDNAVRIGNRWYSLNRVSPLGNLMSVGGSLYELSHSPDATALSVLIGGAAAIGKSVADQTFLQGLSGALDAVRDPGQYAGDFARQTATSIIPAGVQAVVRATQDAQPDERGAKLADVMRARVGSKGALPKRSTALGDPVERRGIGEVLDPFSSKPAKAATDPVIAELANIKAVVGSLGKLKASKQHKAETAAAYAQRAGYEGKILRGVLTRLFQALGYRALKDDEAKRNEVDITVRRTRAALSRARDAR